MSETITISRDELRSIRRELNEVRQLLQVNDLVNRGEALKILNGIKSETLTDYIADGKVIVISRNAAGQPFFSRKALMGLK